MGTPLQKIYDRFQTKIDEDVSGKESLIFSLVDVAISKSYKTVVHNLKYVLDEPVPPETESYDGEFVENLDNDEIELLALWMFYEWKRRKASKLEGQKRDIGTKDFNRLEDRSSLLKELRAGMKDLLEEIDSLKNEFNLYTS